MQKATWTGFRGKTFSLGMDESEDYKQKILQGYVLINCNGKCDEFPMDLVYLLVLYLGRDFVHFGRLELNRIVGSATQLTT